MRRDHAFSIAILLFVVMAVVPVAEAGLNVPAGYTVSSVLSVGPSDFLGGMDYLSGGDLIYFDGTEVQRYSGGTSTPLFNPPGTVFGSLVKVVGSSTIYLGESTNMAIYQVAAGGGGTQVATVNKSYDLENYGGELYVAYNPNSSPPPGGADARVARITLPGGSLDTIIGDTDGYSGPLTFDADGNLYYCMPNLSLGQPGVEGLYFFTRTQVTGALGSGELDLSDGDFLGDDLTGCYDMEYDDQVGRIFVTTSSDFTNQVEVYDVGTGNVSSWATKTSGTFWSTYLRFRPGSKPFTANNGPDAGVLSLVQNDTIYEIRPSEGGTPPWSAAPPVEAAVTGSADPRGSRVVNGLSLLLVPVATLLVGSLRRRRRGK